MVLVVVEGWERKKTSVREGEDGLFGGRKRHSWIGGGRRMVLWCNISIWREWEDNDLGDACVRTRSKSRELKDVEVFQGKIGRQHDCDT